MLTPRTLEHTSAKPATCTGGISSWCNSSSRSLLGRLRTLRYFSEVREDTLAHFFLMQIPSKSSTSVSLKWGHKSSDANEVFKFIIEFREADRKLLGSFRLIWCGHVCLLQVIGGK